MRIIFFSCKSRNLLSVSRWICDIKILSISFGIFIDVYNVNLSRKGCNVMVCSENDLLLEFNLRKIVSVLESTRLRMHW